jgi:hypothetical protein
LDNFGSYLLTIAKSKMSGWKSVLKQSTNERLVRLDIHGFRNSHISTASSLNWHGGLTASGLDTGNEHTLALA